VGRPKVPLIEVSRVVDEAITMIDEGGLTSLSMRGLGKRMNVNPASLYHHFEGKDELLEAVRDRIVRDVKLPQRIGKRSWEEQLRLVGKALRVAIKKHPNAAFLIAASDPIRLREESHHLYEGILKALIEAGFKEGDALYLLISLETITTGNVMEEVNFGKVLRYGRVDPYRYPFLYRATRGKPRSVTNDYAKMLDDFIEGAKQRLLRDKKPPTARKRTESAVAKPPAVGKATRKRNPDAKVATAAE
jgi:TetR/AcrR family transcriptional regulator, tetracycline repressor protein